MMLKIKIVQRIVAGLTYLLALSTKILLSQKGHPEKQSGDDDSEWEPNERFGLSWRLAVEANNVCPWRTVPPQCYNHVQKYMSGGQYEHDLNLIVKHILLYANDIPLARDGMDAWILDVDDTCISNISYYQAMRFGCDPFDSKIFKAWIMKGMCPAIPAVQGLFKALIEKGFKVFLLTGRDEATLAKITTNNLHNQGFIGYQRLILRSAQYKGQSAVRYKSTIRKEIEGQGYRIWGNVGDQWSDLQGECLGKRTFKIPNPISKDASGFFVSLLFGLGPLLGGIILVAFALAFRLQHALLMGIACGIAFVLGAWQPVQLILSSKIGFVPVVLLLAMGAAIIHVSSSGLLKVAGRKKTSLNDLPTLTGFPVSVQTLQSVISCGAVALHALAEGLALGVAAPKAYGFGRHMVLPVSLHGLPRGAAVASCIYGATDSWLGSLATAAIIGFMGPISAIGSILAGIDYSGLDHIMVLACGGIIPNFGNVVKRALSLDKQKSTCGIVMGIGFATLCLTFTKLVCLHTPYCNSAPEAVR